MSRPPQALALISRPGYAWLRLKVNLMRAVLKHSNVDILISIQRICYYHLLVLCPLLGSVFTHSLQLHGRLVPVFISLDVFLQSVQSTFAVYREIEQKGLLTLEYWRQALGAVWM